MKRLMKTAVVILALVFVGTLLYAAGPAKKQDPGKGFYRNRSRCLHGLRNVPAG